MYSGKDPKDIDKINLQIKEYNEPLDKIIQIEGSGVICMDLKTKRFLVVKNKWGVYGFPKGQIKPREKYIDCAFRELEEETGVTKQMYISGFIIVKRKVYYICFMKEFELFKEKIISKDEIIDMCWCDIFELNPENTNISIKKFIKFYSHLDKLIKEAPYYTKYRKRISKECMEKKCWR